MNAYTVPRRIAVACLVALAVVVLPACDRLFDKGSKDDVYAADKKAAAGDFRAAIALYEDALDGTAKTVEVHYKLALLYDEKKKSPLDALHHMDRYLELAPAGPHVKDAKAYKKEGEMKWLTQISKGSPITQQEAVRVKNENQALIAKVAELNGKIVELRAQKAMPLATNGKGEVVQKPIPPGARTHTVKQGETLSLIALKYYKNKARWQKIQDANFPAMNGTVKIKPGMVLAIP